MPGGYINGGFNIGRSMFPVPFGSFSPAARDYFNRLGALRVGKYDAANAALIDRLVGNGGNLWPASGAFCAMAGYLYPGNGANLVPLKDGHDAGTLNTFVTGDWNAVTGLVGDGSTKYVGTNRMENDELQNDRSVGIYNAVDITTTQRLIGVTSGFTTLMQLESTTGSNTSALSSGTTSYVGTASNQGYNGLTRSTGASFIARHGGSNFTLSLDSNTPTANQIEIFRGNGTYGAARIPFYHIGPNLNGAGELAELDAALDEWVAALAAA